MQRPLISCHLMCRGWDASEPRPGDRADEDTGGDSYLSPGMRMPDV